MEAKNLFDVEKFVVECNDMLSGKFFDIDKRLNKFLSTMAESEDILDFLAECLDNFDADDEFEKAFSFDRKTGAARVTLPNDDKKKLALFMTVFNDLTNGKINSNRFLETYFQDGKLTPVQNFLEKVVRPYRDILCKFFEISPNVSAIELKKRLEEIKPAEVEDEAEQKEEESQLPHLAELLEEIAKTSNQILAVLQFEKKHNDNLDDLEFVTNSIIHACTQATDLMVLNGLVIGLNYVSKKFRNVRHLVEEINKNIYGYYDYLSSLEEDDAEDVQQTETEQE